MEDDFTDTISVPCPSLAVDSAIRMTSAGIIWGSCFGPFNAQMRGLTGMDRAFFTAKSIGQSGFQFGLFAAIFSFTKCGIQRYRRNTDWVNSLTAGVVAGAAIGVGNRNWKQVAGITGIFCSLFHVVNDKSV